ncbi:MAG: FeoA domain-containing protein, partial [Limisphaerales bacterium]
MTEQRKSAAIAQGRCAGAEVCPLSRVPVGTTVCIKALAASPEVREQLQALGLSEKQELKLLSREANFVCQVCNATLDLNAELAEAILVEIPRPVRQLQSLVADVAQPGRKPFRAAARIVVTLAALLIIVILAWQGLTARGNPNPVSPNISPAAATMDIGVLVFREGLETILVLAAIVASMTGTRAAQRKPIIAGAG